MDTLPVGLALIFLAVNLKAFAAREMIKIKTTLSLQRPATDLATSSVLVSNPISSAWFCFVAESLFFAYPLLWTLLLTVTFAAVLHKDDQPEEAYLERRFGQRYTAAFWFCARSNNAFASPIAWPPAFKDPRP